MVIIHDTWEEVEGVEQTLMKGSWTKSGAHYFSEGGWREKVAERWEEVPITIPINTGLTSFHVAPGERLVCVERYDLPEDWHIQWCHEPTTASFDRWINQFKKPYLIIERKVAP